jgi:hypothetical protein
VRDLHITRNHSNSTHDSPKKQQTTSRFGVRYHRIVIENGVEFINIKTNHLVGFNRKGKEALALTQESFFGVRMCCVPFFTALDVVWFCSQRLVLLYSLQWWQVSGFDPANKIQAAPALLPAKNPTFLP